MSDIKPGDVVMLVWGCCHALRRHIGWTTTVKGVQYIDAQLTSGCPDCGYNASCVYLSFDESPRYEGSRPDSIGPSSWFRKMPGESVKTEKREECEV